MITRAEVSPSGIITATDQNGAQTEILVDHGGSVHRVGTETVAVFDGENAGLGHIVEVAMEWPPDGPKRPLALNVTVKCPHAAES